MEDTFRVRVDKAFGSLESSSSTTASSGSASLSSLWSLTDEEIERIEWDRQRDNPEDTEPKPYPSKFDGFVAKLQNLAPPGEAVGVPEEIEADLNDLSDVDDSDEGDEESDGDDDGKGKKSLQLTKPDDHDDEEWDIRSSIGLDCTLDYEEEEDEFDKTAVGSEDAGDRMYMKDITGNRADVISFYDELPETFEDAARDPRANHMAAKLRLKEDAETAGKFDLLQVSDAKTNTVEEGINLKSILKRKEKQVDPSLEKRVRFDPDSYDEEEEGSERAKEASFQAAVPDYIRNPSKYKHYTFDSLSDLDEESNRKACMDFLNQLMRPKGGSEQFDDSPADLQKPITFTPRKKPNEALMLKNGNELDSRKDSIPKKGGTMSIAAEEFQGSDDMEVDEAEAETKTSSSQKRGRQYRTKADVDLEELPTI